MTTAEKTNSIAEQLESIIEALGEDPKRQVRPTASATDLSSRHLSSYKVHCF